MSDSKYICDFKITLPYQGKGRGLHEIHLNRVTIDRLSDVTAGFWINEKFEFTKVSEGKFFVMPHQILNIEKVPV